MKQGAKVGVLCFMTAAFFASQCFSAMSGVGSLPIEDPEVIGFLGNVTKDNHWWEARGGCGGVWDDLSSLEGSGSPDIGTYPFETLLTQSLGEAGHLYSTRDLKEMAAGAVPQGSNVAVFRTKKGPRWAGWIPGSSTCGQLQGRGEHSSCKDTRTTPCYHIVESWDIEKMMEEPPTDEYYDALRKDMGQRHPKACGHLLDHLVSLEAFLDKSILFGFSFGVGKAEACVAEGN